MRSSLARMIGRARRRSRQNQAIASCPESRSHSGSTVGSYEFPLNGSLDFQRPKAITWERSLNEAYKLQPAVEPLLAAAEFAQLVTVLSTFVPCVVRPFITTQPTVIAPITRAPARATHSTVTKPSSAFKKPRTNLLMSHLLVSLPYPTFSQCSMTDAKVAPRAESKSQMS